MFATGGRITGPAIHRLAQDETLWTGEPTTASSQGDVLTRRLVTGFRVELGGILVVLGLMVLLSTQ